MMAQMCQNQKIRPNKIKVLLKMMAQMCQSLQRTYTLPGNGFTKKEDLKMEGCGKNPCHKTASIAGPGGGRIMVAVEGGKFPAGMVHEQCGPCRDREYQGILADIQALKDKKTLGPVLLDEWERIQDKAEKAMRK